MAEYIEKQAAIDVIDAVFPVNPMKSEYAQGIACGAALAKTYVEQLPSVQPEPCDDPRADVYYLAEKIGIHRLYALVVELRGEPDPCEDAVSRADVEIEIVNLLKGVFVEYEDIAKKVAARLPSVTPKRKTGKWIDMDDHVMCSCCGATHYGSDKNFCPNCGADMRGEQDE